MQRFILFRCGVVNLIKIAVELKMEEVELSEFYRYGFNHAKRVDHV
jgi:hypothetical protein